MARNAGCERGAPAGETGFGGQQPKVPAQNRAPRNGGPGGGVGWVGVGEANGARDEAARREAGAQSPSAPRAKEIGRTQTLGAKGRKDGAVPRGHSCCGWGRRELR